MAPEPRSYVDANRYGPNDIWQHSDISGSSRSEAALSRTARGCAYQMVPERNTVLLQAVLDVLPEIREIHSDSPCAAAVEDRLHPEPKSGTITMPAVFRYLQPRIGTQIGVGKPQSKTMFWGNDFWGE